MKDKDHTTGKLAIELEVNMELEVEVKGESATC